MKTYGVRNTTGIIALKVVQLLLLVSMFGIVIINWNQIPDEIPLHYDALGNPNRWGDKAELWLLPIIALVLHGFLSLVGHFPSMWNMPCDVKKEKQQAIYQCTYGMLQIINTMLLVMFLYATMVSMFNWQLPSWYLFVMLAFIFIPLIWTMFHIRKLNKEED